MDGSLIFDTKIDTKGFKQGTNTIKTQANGLKSTLLSLGKTIGVVFGVAQLIKFGKQAIDTASDLQEVQNVVDTAFGNMAYKMEEFAATSIETYGLSKLASKEMGSLFMAMSTGMGQASDTASDMAVNITGRLGDIMSFYNKTKEEVQTIGKAIYTGETEPLKAIGLVATEANLAVFAMQNGFNKAYNDMAANEKLLVRQQYFLAQTSIAAGDFAKTSDSWANQTRVLSERFKELLGILGQGLIQVLTPVVRFLNTALSYLITFANTVGRVLSSVFNLSTETMNTATNTAAIATGAEDASAGLSDMGSATKKAAKEAKSGTAGFDQLNNMTENIAESAEGAADSMAMMGGGGAYGMDINPTINSADTSKLEDGLSGSIDRIKDGLTKFLGFIRDSFAPIFSSIWTNLQGPIQIFKTIVTGVFTDIQSLALPLIDYFINSYIPYLQQVFTTIGVIVVGLFDTFNMVFSDIWNLAIFPTLQNLITVLLPMVTDIATKTVEVFGVLFEEVKKIFDMIWQDAIAPALAIATNIWTGFVDTLAEFWNKWGAPIFEGIKEAFRVTGDVLRTVWQSVIKPVWDTFMKVVDRLWTEHLQPLLANFLDLVGEFVSGALEIYNKFIAPLVKWFVEKLGPPLARIISGIITQLGDWIGTTLDVVSDIIVAFKGLIKFVTGVFTGDWKKAWEGIQDIFKGIFDALVDIARNPINSIIDIINGMIKGIVSGINTVIRAVNSIKFDVPDWIPGIGGKSVGFNLKEFTAPQIPRLATGTVVPANYGEFMAILGDNKRETEVVSPLSTMKQAFKEVLAEMGGAGQGTIELNVYLEGKQIHSEVVRQDRVYRKKTGKSAFAN